MQTEYSRFLAEASLPGAIVGLSTALAHETRLRAISDGDASKRPAEGRWSPKELIGHLCDSASNNTQRFVRAQIPAHLTDGTLRIAGYAQNEWVNVQSHNLREWSDLIELWLAMNRHILHIVKTVNKSALKTPISIGDNAAVSLEYVIVDYTGHLIHHLQQIA